MALSKPKSPEEEIIAQDSGTYRAKKDRAQLKKKGIKSPNLAKQWSVEITKTDLLSGKKRYIIYKPTKKLLIESMNSKSDVTFGEIQKPR